MVQSRRGYGEVKSCNIRHYTFQYFPVKPGALKFYFFFLRLKNEENNTNLSNALKIKNKDRRPVSYLRETVSTGGQKVYYENDNQLPDNKLKK